jgi:hypothetical protein
MLCSLRVFKRCFCLETTRAMIYSSDVMLRMKGSVSLSKPEDVEALDVVLR